MTYKPRLNITSILSLVFIILGVILLLVDYESFTVDILDEYVVMGYYYFYGALVFLMVAIAMCCITIYLEYMAADNYNRAQQVYHMVAYTARLQQINRK